MTKLDKSQQFWNQLGEADAMWTVLSAPDKLGGKWDPQEFYATGVSEIDAVFARLVAQQVAVNTARALDFGCGIGRLSQALATRFDRVVGVDIAPSMIEQATRANQFGERVSYAVNSSDDLSLFASGSFTFVYSMIVLQHIRRPYSLNYLREFARVAASGAVLVFQIPEIDRNDLKGSVARNFRRAVNRSPFLVRAVMPLMYRSTSREFLKSMPSAFLDVEPIDRRFVAKVLAEGGVRILSVDDIGEQGLGMRSLRYTAVKD